MPVGVAAVQTVFSPMENEVTLLWLIHNKHATVLTVMHHMTLFDDVGQGQNIGDGFGVMPCFAMTLQASLHVGLE